MHADFRGSACASACDVLGARSRFIGVWRPCSGRRVACDLVIKSHLINVVATPLRGVCIFEAARSERRTAPWLQRVRIYEMAFWSLPLTLGLRNE